VAIGTGGLQLRQNCAFDPHKRTSKTPQPSQNLSSLTLTTSEECRESPQQYWVFQFDDWLIWLTVILAFELSRDPFVDTDAIDQCNRLSIRKRLKGKKVNGHNHAVCSAK